MNKIEQLKKWKNDDILLYLNTTYDTTKKVKIANIWDGTIFGSNAVIKIIFIDDDNNKTGEMITSLNNINIKGTEDAHATKGTYDYEISIVPYTLIVQ
jgi:hypothetical protein